MRRSRRIEKVVKEKVYIDWSVCQSLSLSVCQTVSQSVCYLHDLSSMSANQVLHLLPTALIKHTCDHHLHASQGQA